MAQRNERRMRGGERKGEHRTRNAVFREDSEWRLPVQCAKVPTMHTPSTSNLPRYTMQKTRLDQDGEESEKDELALHLHLVLHQLRSPSSATAHPSAQRNGSLKTCRRPSSTAHRINSSFAHPHSHYRPGGPLSRGLIHGRGYMSGC
eukprot:scaffold21001_cov30-Tisochrysis_lutea.AAC.1